MLSVAEAIRAVLDRVPRMPVVSIALDDACGAVVGEAVVAGRASPPFDNSAMDGYAARASDLPGRLRVVDTIAAGASPAEFFAPGTAVRIFTGAPLPPGADTVVIQEDATREGDVVALPAAPPGDNIRRAGEDIAIGETVIAAGTRLRPWELGVCAAIGLATLPCHRAPRVALIATGDELVELGTLPGPGQIVDSSAHALAALVREAGGLPSYLGIARDDDRALAALVATALEYDAVITTGGVSVGDRDRVRDVLAASGVTLELWKVAMKPGKPFAFGMRGTTPVFGLPGNPVSTVVAFELFIRPALIAMQGAATCERPRVPVQLVAPYRKQAGRTHFLRARVERAGTSLIAHVHPKQGSAMLSSLVATNALVEISAELTAASAGSTVSAILLEPV